MAKVPYTKIPLLFEQQVEQLTERGLIIDNPRKALHLLSTLSYYRLSGYWYPFLEDKENHKFKSGSTFEQAFRIYCFDRELKNLISGDLEKIEVALRSTMIYKLSHEHGTFWYTNSNLFIDIVEHSRFLINLQDCYNKSKEEFIKSFKKNYAESLPPTWMGMEIISFGALSKLYNNLKPGKPKRSIASQFSLSDTVLESWLHALTYLRNTCAHHARLWNKVMNVQPSIPTSLLKDWLSNKSISNSRVYYFMSIILYLQHTVNPNTSFHSKFKRLLEKYPEIDVTAMGFPENWQDEYLWRDKV